MNVGDCGKTTIRRGNRVAVVAGNTSLVAEASGEQSVSGGACGGRY
jgi:hypothetical protein